MGPFAVWSSEWASNITWNLVGIQNDLINDLDRAVHECRQTEVGIADDLQLLSQI